MPLVDRDAFAETPCARIYIARTLEEAHRVEALLSGEGFDYVVEVEPFRTLLLGILPREYDGAAFYVPVASADDCRRLLFEAGLRTGIVEDEENVEPPDRALPPP